MNSFIKTFLASLLAICVSSVFIFGLGFVLLIASIGSIFSNSSTTTSVTVKPNTILKIDFSTPIVESLSENPLVYLDLSAMEFHHNITTFDVLKSINMATTDSSITGIYLDMTNPPLVDIANMEEIRNALLKFKESGKKIYSYADVYTQKSYYLSSVADEIVLCPVGEVQWMGLSNMTPFFKGTLDKIGVNVEVFKYGKYKSAVEPFMLSEMSDANREQSSRMLNNLWRQIVEGVSESRNIETAKLEEYASNLSLQTANDATEKGFVNRLTYKNEFEESLKSVHTLLSFNQYVEANATREFVVGAGSNSNQIAIIYADGEIVSGKSQNGIVGDVSLNKKIAEAANNDDVKAIVLRVNSPGGSALASDVINKEVCRAKAKKPVVVSMGTYAASGGYYISSNADAIVASPFTLTGSIGVFGIMMEASETLKEKVGVTFDGVKTNPYADMGTPFRAMTPGERLYFQKGVDRVYETFVHSVCEGRKKTFEQIDSIAQGRVWTATDAMKLSLVDACGGLMDAVVLAAEKADIRDNYIVKNNRSSSSDFLTTVLSMMSMESVSILANKLTTNKIPSLGLLSDELKKLERIITGDKIQAITPFYYNL